MKLASFLVLGTAVVSAEAQETTTNCSLMCSDEFEPVCGSDDITYQNECNMNLANCENPDAVTKVHDGACNISGSASWMAAMDDNSTEEIENACSGVCPMIYKPVCGSDGETYSNDCTLAFAQCKSAGAITLMLDGECPGHSFSETTGCSEVCLVTPNFVCGSDGVTYLNSCVAICKNPSITRTSEGACPEKSENDKAECSEVCIKILKPVCGSDGITYPNSCFLGIATCQDPSITQVKEGVCTDNEGNYDTNSSSTDSNEETTEDTEKPSDEYAPSCPDVCLTIYSPVCGSDGVTYSNSCKLGIASCNHPELHLTKVSDGSCSSECKTQL